MSVEYVNIINLNMLQILIRATLRTNKAVIIN